MSPAGEELDRTPSGLPCRPHYLLDEEALARPGGKEHPGEFPYTRGIHPGMYREKLWTMRQYSGFIDSRSTNARFRFLLGQGQTGLSVAFDLPTQIGYDSDAPLARGEVGKVGVPISTAADLEELFRGIPLDSVSVSMTINSTAAILLAFLVVAARRSGIPPAALRGTLQNDILKEFVARRTYRFPIVPSLRLCVDVLAYCAREMPRWNPISVSGYHIRESGSTAEQELAFTLANGIAYLEAGRARGIAPEVLAPRFSFFFNAQMDLFEEVAKFRAARRLWARIVAERFGVQDPEAQKLRFHAQTAGSALAFQEPENNAARVTIQALAAVLGGTQSLHTNAIDEALGLPTEASARAALRTQQIIAHESGITRVADPLGGCPLVEALTDELAARAGRRIEEIDRAGGAVSAIEAGLIQREIEDASYRLQKEVEDGRRVVVGVNRFRGEGGPAEIPTFRIDPRLEEERVRSLEAAKRARHSGNIAALREGLKAAARSTENLMPSIIAAAEGGVTLGEIMATLTEVFGEAR
jgi:methylmalonyl-CoA mutase, N-terminal domain